MMFMILLPLSAGEILLRIFIRAAWSCKISTPKEQTYNNCCASSPPPSWDPFALLRHAQLVTRLLSVGANKVGRRRRRRRMVNWQRKRGDKRRASSSAAAATILGVTDTPNFETCGCLFLRARWFETRTINTRGHHLCAAREERDPIRSIMQRGTTLIVLESAN